MTENVIVIPRKTSVAGYPFATTFLYVASFDRSPSDAMGGFFLPGIIRMGRKCVIEGFAIYILCVCRQMVANRWREIKVLPIRRHA